MPELWFEFPCSDWIFQQMSLLWKLLECEYVSLKKSVGESNPRSSKKEIILCTNLRNNNKKIKTSRYRRFH